MVAMFHDWVPDFVKKMAQVSERLRENIVVPVEIVPEPNNPYDKKAIAFSNSLI